MRRVSHGAVFLLRRYKEKGKSAAKMVGGVLTLGVSLLATGTKKKVLACLDCRSDRIKKI